MGLHPEVPSLVGAKAGVEVVPEGPVVAEIGEEDAGTTGPVEVAPVLLGASITYVVVGTVNVEDLRTMIIVPVSFWQLSGPSH